jgi:hypothetical protein
MKIKESGMTGFSHPQQPMTECKSSQANRLSSQYLLLASIILKGI